MSAQTDAPATDQRPRKWRLIGPGIVVAATGVGAGDLVATLVAGSRFGYTLLWAAVIGCVVKISLAEATGRWHLATGRTIFDGWRSLGKWTTVYFAIYVVVWGFVFGATAMSSAGLALNALFPVLDLRPWAILCGLAGLAFVLVGRYGSFEKVMAGLIGIMFVTVVSMAIAVSPNIPDAIAGLVPRVPDGSVIYTLGLVGGVGGTITMAAYGYWINAKGWSDSSWMRVMRLDNRVAYVTTGLFVVALLIVGAELLYQSGLEIGSGDQGLVNLGALLEDEFGVWVAKVFLVGFFATAFSSLLGVWQGVSMMFADFVTNLRGERGGGATAEHAAEVQTSWPFRAYALWLTFPPMALLWLDQPFGLAIAYGALGAFFMPFLAITLLWLLNSPRVPREWRNGWLSNTLLAVAGLLFIVLCIVQLQDAFSGA